MKWIMFILPIVCLCLVACEEKEGYLRTENAVYEPDTMVVRLVPDPELDAVRIEYKSPWQSLAMQGYEGTERIDFTVESVSSTAGEVAVTSFMKEVSILGGGILRYPFEGKSPAGRYTVSVRLTGPGYSQVVKDAFTFILK
ncbi:MULTISPECIES: hypothetical protein [Sanguibacteroides]|uniref:DUF4625 domain-containing protein n=1 Tax=Sanguibacteroides justesenii TaxID=1547597 RepID=A0A0C3RFI7_9PORP|nr:MULTISPECIES: hypothetical protein [Sanguibacteroides]KIO44024.1 hypothetical protein BA92_11610 [Sanguibacteroides justesenii]KIO47316.1 hypothetical protein IE90_01640 [Sanguibacteroides justesenii]PXZ43939.1 hypothetical protein DMB45_08160 [Sanguibacteroides justesenii]